MVHACPDGRAHARAPETINSAPLCVQAALELVDWPLISRQARHVVEISRSASGNSFAELDDRGIACAGGACKCDGSAEGRQAGRVREAYQLTRSPLKIRRGGRTCRHRREEREHCSCVIRKIRKLRNHCRRTRRIADNSQWETSLESEKSGFSLEFRDVDARRTYFQVFSSCRK